MVVSLLIGDGGGIPGAGICGDAVTMKQGDFYLIQERANLCELFRSRYSLPTTPASGGGAAVMGKVKPGGGIEN